jgi:hypothetical protein
MYAAEGTILILRLGDDSGDDSRLSMKIAFGLVG